MGIFLRWSFIALCAFAVHFAHAAETQDISPQAQREYESVMNTLQPEDMRTAISQVWRHGLNPNAYQPNEKSFLQLLSDVSIGSVDPAFVADDIKLRRKAFLTPKQLQAVVVASGNRADLLIENMAPQNLPYQSLKASLNRVYTACANNTWVRLPALKKTLKMGVRDSSVPALKQYMSLLGYRFNSMDDTVDQDTVKAINDIEWNLHVKPDGTLSPGGRVWKFMSIPCVDRVRQLQADMEKMRWFPQRFEDRFVFINLALTYFVMIDQPQNKVLTFRTVNGRPERKSLTMRDKVTRVILNPYWVVPPTIFLEDKVADLKGKSSYEIAQYFDSHNYEVWNSNFTKRMDPNSIDWNNINSAADADFYIRQRPNYMNALGSIKFEMGNPYSIYLHDTNQRELFAEPQRLLSSGCIRLERPLDFAEYLLQGTSWTRDAISSALAVPGQVMDRDTAINLKNPMPVYMIFMTSQISSDGILRFTEDSYNQNTSILQTMRGVF